MTRRPPRVLQAPHDVAGQLTLAALGLREIGIDATAFSRSHEFDYETGPDVAPSNRLEWLALAAREARRADVAHFHFGQSFLPESLRAGDARMLRLAGKSVIVEFHGSDIRMPSLERQANPYYEPLAGESDEGADRRMHRWSAVTEGHVILSDHALRKFAERHFSKIHMVPLRLNVKRFRPTPPEPDRKRPKLVHAPSNRAAKGTRFVRAAVEALHEKGRAFDYVELHGMSNEVVLEELAGADLVVDQLCLGAHGVFAVEAWAQAKPVICNVSSVTRAGADPLLPSIDATPESVERVIDEWLRRPLDRHELGLASRDYALRVHDVSNVAERLLGVYAQLPRNRSKPR